MKTALLLLAASLPLLFAGCATTPAQRINQNQPRFDSLPHAAQPRIPGGQIDLGFTPDMVRLALGEPQRILIRRTHAGETEVWLYVDVSRRYERQRADIDGLTLPGAPGARAVGGGAWINVLQEREFIRQRVEFVGGTVFAVEEVPPENPAQTAKSRRP